MGGRGDALSDYARAKNPLASAASAAKQGADGVRGLTVKHFFMAAALAAATAPGAPAGAASAAVQDAADAQVLRIPFDPPLGTPLRYRYQQSDGTGAPAKAMIVSLRFEKAGEGWRLTATHSPAGHDGAAPPALPGSAPGGAAATANWFAMPLVLRLGADGEILGVENQAEYGAAILRAQEAMFEEGMRGASPEKRAQGEAILEMLRATPIQDHIDTVIGRLAPILEFGGVELMRDEPTTAELAEEASDGRPFTRHVSIEVERIEDGRADLVMTVTTPGEDFMIATAPMVAKTDAVVPGEPQLEGGSMTTRGTYRLGTDDGMLHRFTGVTTMEMKVGGQTTRSVEQESLERLD